VLIRRRVLLASAALGWACDGGRASRGGGGHRVVSLSPNTTEAMFAIGADELLVGRSSQCDYPPEATRLPSAGDYANPNIEAIIALRPSLVIGEQGPVGPQIQDKLRAHGVDTFFPATDSVADITSMLRKLGERVSHAQSARQLAQRIDTRIAQLATWAHPREQVSVIMVFDVSPIFVAGPGSFPDELLRLAGGTNPITRGGKWPTIDIEHLLSLNPAVIIDAMGVGHAAVSRVGKAPGWKALTAVKAGRVRRLRTSAALRPGPRIADGLADVAHAVHGATPT
jgi:iron complex transport system substrate-binding protein